MCTHTWLHFLFVLHLAIGEKQLTPKTPAKQKTEQQQLWEETHARGTNEFSSTLDSPSFAVTSPIWEADDSAGGDSGREEMGGRSS